MDLDSEPGKGIQVSLYVPLKDKDDIEPSRRERSQRHEKFEMIKVILADDPHIMREGLRIGREDDLTVIGEADDGAESSVLK